MWPIDSFTFTVKDLSGVEAERLNRLHWDRSHTEQALWIRQLNNWQRQLTAVWPVELRLRIFRIDISFVHYRFQNVGICLVYWFLPGMCMFIWVLPSCYFKESWSFFSMFIPGAHWCSFLHRGCSFSWRHGLSSSSSHSPKKSLRN